jgi:two-component system nitrogen regulation response regulator NtrX
MRRKALIVEDDPHTRRLLVKLIESQDCKVDEAGDGLMAIEMLSKTDYDVVLLDIVLPKLSGTAVMDHLFMTNPAMLERTIVVTGLNVEDIRKLFPTVCHALSKPVIPNRLMDSIHKCLEARLEPQSHIA